MSSFLKKLSVFIFAFFLQQGSLSALLPPLWENIAEIKSILEDKRLGNYLSSGEVLMEIKKTQEGWLLITNQSELSVRIIYKPAAMPGPAHYTIEFEKPIGK